jgi:hypothetical protein
MAGPPTLVADALIWAGAGCVPWLFAVEAQGFHAAFRCYVSVRFQRTSTRKYTLIFFLKKSSNVSLFRPQMTYARVDKQQK